MDNAIALTGEDFIKPTGYSVFSNLEKSIDIDAFHLAVKREGLEVYGASDVNKFVTEFGHRIEKAEGDNKAELIKARDEQVGALSKVTVSGRDGVSQTTVFIKKTAETIEKAEDNDIEKGDLSRAFEYGGNIKFTKTGKEIKEKLNVVKDETGKCKDKALGEMAEYAAKVGEAPTEKVYKYGPMSKMLPDMNEYSWEKTRFKNNNDRTGEGGGVASYSENAGKSVTPAFSQEQADAAKAYNGQVRKYMEAAKDHLQADLMERNLDDKKSYELSPDQIVALKF